MERLALGPGGLHRPQDHHHSHFNVYYHQQHKYVGFIIIAMIRQAFKAPPKEADGEQVCKGGQG